MLEHLQLLATGHRLSQRQLRELALVFKKDPGKCPIRVDQPRWFPWRIAMEHTPSWMHPLWPAVGLKLAKNPETNYSLMWQGEGMNIEAVQHSRYKSVQHSRQAVKTLGGSSGPRHRSSGSSFNDSTNFDKIQLSRKDSDTNVHQIDALAVLVSVCACSLPKFMTSDADQVEASTCQCASVCICLLRQREPGKRTIYFL